MLDSFIFFALQRIEAELHALAGESTAIISEAAPTLPGDYAHVRSLTRPQAGGGFVELKPMVAMEAEKWSNYTGGDAVGYIITGDTVAFYPPDAKDMTLVYQSQLTLPADAAGTNWALTGFFDLVINASMVEVADYEQNTELAMRYESKYQQQVDRYEVEQDRNRYGPGIATASQYNAYSRPPRSM